MPPPTYPPATPDQLPDVPLPPGNLGGVTINKAALDKQAATQVNQEVQAQIDPIQALVDQYATQQGRAVTDINNLYGDANAGTGIFGASRTSADNVKSSYDNLLGGENAVFAEASARLNDLRAKRGADAQHLAQQIGAPVPASMFTDPVDLETRLSIPEFSGAKLQSLGLAAGGVQQAEAFAGQVMPMMKARQVQETRNHFQDLIAEEKKQIQSLKSQRPGLISARQRDLLTQERTYKLSKLQADRDWWMARQQAQARVDELNVSMRNQDAGNRTQVQVANANNKAQATAQAKQTATIKHAADVKALAEAHNNALAVAEGLMNPGTKSVRVSIPDPNNPGKFQTVTQQITPVAITDPNRLIEQILASPGVGKDVKKNKEFVKWLVQQIRNKARASGNPDAEWWADPKHWAGYGESGQPPDSPAGETGGHTLPEFRRMQQPVLENYAKTQLGFKGGYPKAIKDKGEDAMHTWLINWVWTRQQQLIEQNRPYPGKH